MTVDDLAAAQNWECAQCSFPLERRGAFIVNQGADESAICEPCAEVGIRLQSGILISGVEDMLGIHEEHTRQL